MSTVEYQTSAGPTGELNGDHESDDDLDLLVAARRRGFPKFTWFLVMAVLAGGAFLGGVQVDKHFGSSSSSSTGIDLAALGRLGGGGFGTGGFGTAQAGAGAGANPSAGGGAGTGGTAGVGGTGTGGRQGGAGAGGFGNATVGQVTGVSGNTITITDFQGQTVTVHADGAAVTKSDPAAVSDLKPGDVVVVQGQKAADGSVTARSVSIGAPGGFGRGGGNRNGGGAGAGAGSGGATPTTTPAGAGS